MENRMRTSLLHFIVIIAAIALTGCTIAQKAIGLPDAANTAQGELAPPPAGDSATAGWLLTLGEAPLHKKLDVSQFHAEAKALQGKIVTITFDSPQPPILIEVVRSIQIAKLKGVIRRVDIDSRHPTAWMFKTHLSNVAFDAFFDPSHIPTPEQWVGKNVVITAHFEGQVRTGLKLVADTIEPQT